MTITLFIISHYVPHYNMKNNVKESDINKNSQSEISGINPWVKLIFHHILQKAHFNQHLARKPFWLEMGAFKNAFLDKPLIFKL